METQSKWLWSVTIANSVVARILLLGVYSMLLALAVLAPEISGWPLAILLPIGIVLSVMGLSEHLPAAPSTPSWTVMGWSLGRGARAQKPKVFIPRACSECFVVDRLQGRVHARGQKILLPLDRLRLRQPLPSALRSYGVDQGTESFYRC